MNIDSSVIIFKSIKYTLVLVGIILAFFVARMYVNAQATDACYKISSYKKEIKAEGAIASYPIDDVTKNCLRQKGLL